MKRTPENMIVTRLRKNGWTDELLDQLSGRLFPDSDSENLSELQVELTVARAMVTKPENISKTVRFGGGNTLDFEVLGETE